MADAGRARDRDGVAARRPRTRDPDRAAAVVSDRDPRRPGLRAGIDRRRLRRARRRRPARRRRARRRPAPPAHRRRRRLHDHRGPLGADRRRHQRLAGRRSCAPAPGPRAGCAFPPATRCWPTSCPPSAYGRAYGFERAMDNLGAIGGPLLALGLVALVGVRTAILLSIIPGLLAVAAILYAIRHTAAPAEHEHRPIRLHVRPVLHGPARAPDGWRSRSSSSATSPPRC